MGEIFGCGSSNSPSSKISIDPRRKGLNQCIQCQWRINGTYNTKMSGTTHSRMIAACVLQKKVPEQVPLQNLGSPYNVWSATKHSTNLIHFAEQLLFLLRSMCPITDDKL